MASARSPEDALVAWGGLKQPLAAYRSRRRAVVYGWRKPPEGARHKVEVWAEFKPGEDEQAARNRILQKLRVGVLRGSGLVRGGWPDTGRIDIHPDQWDVLKLDFNEATAKSPGAILDGILICEGDAAADSLRYGQKTAKAKEYIVKNAAQLKELGSQSKQAKELAKAIGCSMTTAKSAIRDECSSGGQLSGRK